MEQTLAQEYLQNALGSFRAYNSHYAYHIGQIVFLAKHFRSTEWKTLSIPRNRSAEFNKYLSEKKDEPDKAHRFDAAAGFTGKQEK